MATATYNSLSAPLDLFDPQLRRDPYPAYAELRRAAPLAEATTPAFGRVWMATRYADVAAILKDPRFSSDVQRLRRRRIIPISRWMPRGFNVIQNSMVTTDDPAHARLRRLVHLAFTPRRVENLAGRIETIVDSLLDELEHQPVVDIVSGFALPLPLAIISDMMGVAEKDRAWFRARMGSLLEFGAGSMAKMLRQMPDAFRLVSFFRRMIAERRANPQDDLITALVQAEQEGDRMNEDELLAMIFVLLLAGHETTVNLIGSGTLALIEHRDQLRLLHERPDLIDSAVEELLRYTNPVEHGTVRITTEPVTLHGVDLPAGSRVLALLSSANRDESVFAEPDRLDITRSPNRHLAFGLGIHYCLGAPLARLEGTIALRKLTERFPNMRLAEPPSAIQWRNTVAVRGLKGLPVRLL